VIVFFLLEVSRRCHVADIIVFDTRLGGSPPWKHASATCVVDERHTMSSIVTWLKSKCKKYSGSETVYIMAHGNQGYVQLGKDGLSTKNAHLWRPLYGKLYRIIILACNVAEGSQGDSFCSKLASYTASWVTAAECKQIYFYLPLGILPVSFGSWDGRVDTWDPGGNWHSSYEEPDPDYSSFTM
jgi:hypothetical protein